MSYQTETYPVSIDVRVSFTVGGVETTHQDAIKGENVDHAMTRAYQNWPGAEIEFLGMTDDETEEK